MPKSGVAATSDTDVGSTVTDVIVVKRHFLLRLSQSLINVVTKLDRPVYSRAIPSEPPENCPVKRGQEDPTGVSLL